MTFALYAAICFHTETNSPVIFYVELIPHKGALMDAAQRLCIQRIDEIDLALADIHQTNKNDPRPVLSRGRRSGPQSTEFIQKKLHLLEAMREAFIESRTKSLRISALLLFCYNNGLELVTHSIASNKRACFLLRTPGFDLLVDSGY